MPAAERLQALQSRLDAALGTCGPGTLADAERDLWSLEGMPGTATYHELPRRLGRSIRERLATGDTERYAQHCQQILLLALRARLYAPRPLCRADALVDELLQAADRVLRTIEARDGAYHLDSDVFVKDLACFTGRMVPCGVYVIDRYGGWPKRYLARPSLRRLPANWLFTRRAGGLAPLAQLHLHTPMLDRFSEAGRDHSFTLIACLLREQPQLLGVMGSAWYYDPRVAEISPHLAYLREAPAKHGAMLVCLGATDAATSSALVRSATRRRLHERGAYTPREYALFWPRKPFLAWADTRT